MVKYSNGPDFDQHDEKVFRETLGTFGTGTKPGGNQLQELQAKVRQGVKHVELNLYGSGKGQFGQQDTPDKYGFEQRRTIMQLAKLNEQTLSVHSSFDLTSFSGITQQGFNESERWKVMKEVDETIKFAAETAKQGAIVMHVHESQLPTPPSEINLPKKYLDWLKEKKPEEYKRLQKEYLSSSPLDRQFFEKPEMIHEIKTQYERLNNTDKEEFKKKYSKDLSKAQEDGKEEWRVYYEKQKLEKMKLAPDMNPLIVVGDKIDQVDRKQELINVDLLTDKKDQLKEDDKKVLEGLGIHLDSFDLADFQKANALFTNGFPKEFEGKVDEDKFNNLKDKLIVNYEKYLNKNNNMQSQADKEFFKELNKTNMKFLNMQKTNLERKREMFKDEMELINELDAEQKKTFADIAKFDNSTEKGKASRDALKAKISEKKKEIQHLKYQVVGQEEYQELSKYDETVAQINKQISELKDRKTNVRSLTDEVFNKNTSSIAHLGIKALSYQLDLKNKAKNADNLVQDYENQLKELEQKYTKASQKDDLDEANEINQEMNILRSAYKKTVGLKDYEDIDVDEKPLYIAPENMIVGYGYMTNLEEYKALIRESWREFAHKIQSNDPIYVKIREDYETETGNKITTEKQALELAKKHIGGTFDNAHAAVWLKYFKREEGESEESKIERFNKWLNDEAESMAKEGIIKHIHLNDSLGKDDDHNLIGTGLLDIHDLRHRLRKAGIEEPFIIEVGGRGAATNLTLANAFDTFNPTLGSQKGTIPMSNSGVSDWISTERDYQNRPQYSSYGMGYSTFRHQPPQQGQQKGDWSGTSFF